MSGILAGQSMTSTSCCIRKAVVSYTKFRPKCPSPREVCCRREAGCSFGGWGFHPAPPVHSSHHGGWHPIQWLRVPRLPCVGWMHISINLSPCLRRTRAHDNHRETVWSETHYRGQSGPSVWGPSFSAFSPTHGGVACDPKSIWDTWQDVSTESQQTKASLQCPKLTASSEIVRSCPHADCPSPFGSTVCLPGLWSDPSDLHASADVADQCLSCIAKCCWHILATHPRVLPLLAENNPPISQ